MSGSPGNGDYVGICFTCAASSGLIGVNEGDFGYFPSTGKAINDGLWHTVLVIYDGTAIYIYADGIVDNIGTNWNTGSTAPISSTVYTSGNSGNYLGLFTLEW